MSESYDTLPKVLECVSLLDDLQTRGIMTARLWGQSSAEIGRQLGMTRETVRRRCETALNKMRKLQVLRSGSPKFYEDKYVDLFLKYNISSREIAYFFKEPVSTQAFLDIVKIGSQVGPRSSRLPIVDVLSDASIDPELRLVLMRPIRGANHVFVFNEKVKRAMVPVAVVALKHVSPNELSLKEIIAVAKEGLAEGGMRKDDPFYRRYRLVSQNVRDAENVMTCFGGRFRYYDFSSVNAEDLISDFHLKDYDGLVISTKLLVRNYAEMLPKYGISNEVHLHNLLRHVLANRDDFSFGRLPVVYVGNADKKKQLEAVCRERGCSKYELVKICDELFGFSPIIVYNIMRTMDDSCFAD